MKYWPFSVIKNSPLAPPQFAWEYHRLPQTYSLTNEAIEGAVYVAMNTPAREAPNLAVVHSEGSPARRMFIRHPDPAEWADLERFSAIVQDENIFILCDVVH